MDHVASALVYLILHAATGERMSVDALADDLARRDVVFLGEEHDNTAGHRFQAEVVEALRKRRPDLVISMEMFERDVQGVVDDYVRGRIDEKTFLENARPWKDHAKHYRPVVEIAREHGLDLIAANVARDAARKASVRGADTILGEPGIARFTSAPADRYRELFADAMKDHVGADGGDAVERMYEAQCLKDDTMAEAITDYFDQHRHRRPLVVHLCGKFHSDYGLGTAVRTLWRRPLLQIGVVTMVAVEDPEKVEAKAHREKGHFIVAVPEEPKPEKKKPEAKEGEKAAEEPAVAETDPVAGIEVKASEPKVTEEKPAEVKPAEETGGRAALGIMPDYAASDDPGVGVSGVTPGGAADTAGLKAGDRILKIGTAKIADLEDYMAILEEHKAGETVDITFSRDGKEQTLKVKLQVSHR